MKDPVFPRITPSMPRPSQNPVRAALAFAAVAMLACGLAYPLAATGLGRLLFPHQATGSPIVRDGRVVGSSLVAQPFADARYFRSRPSAAGYDPMRMSGSNEARSNPDLRRRLAEAVAEVAVREGADPDDVPGDLVTQSGSGIDPHIGPPAARLQVARVAAARGLDRAVVERLLVEHTEGRQFGILGRPRVNVLALNLALDDLQRGLRAQ